jgi:hypothetical protein
MAKKKKRGGRQSRRAVEEVAEPNMFWRQAWALLLFVMALFLLFGAFGTGGVLPKDVYHGIYWAFGWAAILTPVAFIFFGVLKFTEEDHKIPFSKLLGMVLLVCFLA